MDTYRVIIHPAALENNALNLTVGDVEQSRNYNGELGADWSSVGQSRNIEDRRDTIAPRGMRRVQVRGNLTWKTYFHLASSVPLSIAQCLLRRGFSVTDIHIDLNGWSSNYSFWISLYVFNQYSLANVRANVAYALTDVAIASSIRIRYVF